MKTSSPADLVQLKEHIQEFLDHYIAEGQIPKDTYIVVAFEMGEIIYAVLSDGSVLEIVKLSNLTPEERPSHVALH